MTTTVPDHKHDPNSLGEILIEHRRQNPGEPLLVLKKGLHISPAFKSAMIGLLEQLQAEAPGPVVLTALSNATTSLNPFSGLGAHGEAQPAPAILEGMVNLLGPGEWISWYAWPDHFSLISADAVAALAVPGISAKNAMSQLHDAGGSLLLSDRVFLHDPSADLFHEEALEPHEQKQPDAWGKLRQRLDLWLRLTDVAGDSAWVDALASFQRAEKPVTLHITHSWGGGVAKWVESFIEADEGGVNLQLRSEEAETGKGYGQRFSLYLDTQLTTPIASWWIQPPIQSSATAHTQYQQVLDRILSRYGVGRIIVSSLVGHSLDALAAELPTLQVLHDFYPLWPLLGIHPQPFIENSHEHALDTALQQHPLLPGFRTRSAGSWKRLSRQWRETVSTHEVRVTAPSHSVANLIRQLDPAWNEVDIAITPHGLPDLPGTSKIEPRDRDDGRLRLVIPGRIQDGKGRQLLLKALPALVDHAQVYLLGAGKDGEAFFGMPGVNVIVQYQREDLRELLAKIGPHAAALLSVVPETFSYTLSEMQQLNIPVIATRVGSFEERIEDGETGWLIDPEPQALVDRVLALAADPGAIREMRGHAGKLESPGSAEMVKKYQAICAPRPASEPGIVAQSLDKGQIAALAFQNTELTTSKRALESKAVALQTEVEKRTAWAEAREQERKKEVERRIEWVAELEDRIAYEQAEHRQTTLHLENLRSVHDWVLSTASWRFTKPFRVFGRILSSLGRARAWNPFRWPLLLSQTVRTISTEGISGALKRSQAGQIQPGKRETVNLTSFEPVGDPAPPTGFPVYSEPEVSVIIPVYNKWEYTAACLRSLAEAECRARFEVIVVDDQSQDETPGRLEGISGLINIRNKQNLGFVGSSNRGATAAKGRYLVMLNNDTQVLDGWLDALIDTFRRFPDTGIAGARLVYPDGTLQEAGGLIFRDGSGWNYGRGDNPDRPEYQYTRETDYCSGACIMMDTSLFRELGGFDTHYAPAYYEDTDLAFRVRAKGLKVRIQSEATIVHHEGITSGTDLAEGAKRFQAVNREKFLERWGEVLDAYPGPIQDPDDSDEIRKARDHRLRGRILVIDAYTPEPDQDSGSVRLCYLLDCLVKLGYGVTFMADNKAYAGRYTDELQHSGIEVVYEPWVDSVPKFFSERGAEFDYVMISRHYVASNYVSLLRRHCPQAKFIFDTVDLHYLREERMAELEESQTLRHSAAQTRRSELSVINSADATIVVSPVEKTVLESAAPGAHIHIISNIHEVSGSQRPFAERKDIFFVGGYQHPPNVDAALWFVNRIWPLVHEELPDMQFHLIGSKAPEQVRNLHGNGVCFHGFVKSLDPWLDGCRLAVAPLRYGAGIKGKVNMSMSRGQPVVATPMAVEGMFAQSGRDVLVAETPEAFAADIIRLYRDQDLWSTLSAGGLENVRQYFSIETARLGLQELLNSLK